MIKKEVNICCNLGYRLVKNFTLIVFLGLLIIWKAVAQTAIAPPNKAAGATAGSFSLSGFENIDLFSGNLNFNLPLLSLGGRGKNNIPINLSINNAGSWKLTHPDIVRALQARNINVVLDFYATALVTWYKPQDFNGNMYIDSGTSVEDVKMTTEYGTMQDIPPDGEAQPANRPYHMELYDPANPNNEAPMKKGYYNPGSLSYNSVCVGGRWLNNDPTRSIPGSVLTRLVFRTSDGGSRELRDIKTGGRTYRAGRTALTNSRGRVFVSTDGSAVTFVSDQEITERFDYFEPDCSRIVSPSGKPSGFLLMPDGTRYRINNGSIVSIRDSNGNLTKFGYDESQRVTTIKDPIGRNVAIAYKGDTDTATGIVYDHDEIKFSGMGQASRAIKVWRGFLHDSLTEGTVLKVKELFPAWQMDDSGDTVIDPNDVVLAVEMPDGRRYELKYNAYSELARVVLPTGGKLEYGYVAVGNRFGVNRHVQERRVYDNASDTDPELKQIFSYKVNNLQPADSVPGVQKVDVSQWNVHDNKLLTFETHYFHGDAFAEHLGLYTSWDEGKEFKTETYDTNGTEPTNLLRKVEYTWQPRKYLGWFGNNRNLEPAIDPRIVTTVTTLENGLVSKQTAVDPQSPDQQNLRIGFDDFNNPTDTWEYGFDGQLMLHSHTDYVSDASYIGYTGNIGDTTSPETILSAANLRRLPLLQSVYDGKTGLEQARTSFEYDNYSNDIRHHSLVPRSDIFGLCLKPDNNGGCPVSEAANSNPSGYSLRGNVTMKKNYLLDGNGTPTDSVAVFNQYDVASNVVKAIDANGKATEFFFDDNFGKPDADLSDREPINLSGLQTYAFTTSLKNALGHTSAL